MRSPTPTALVMPMSAAAVNMPTPSVIFPAASTDRVTRSVADNVLSSGSRWIAAAQVLEQAGQADCRGQAAVCLPQSLVDGVAFLLVGVQAPTVHAHVVFGRRQGHPQDNQHNFRAFDDQPSRGRSLIRPLTSLEPGSSRRLGLVHHPMRRLPATQSKPDQHNYALHNVAPRP